MSELQHAPESGPMSGAAVCPACGGAYGRKIVPELLRWKCRKCGGTPDKSPVVDPAAGPVVVSPWTVDARGYLLTPSGCKAARLTTGGILMLWDKRAGCEVPFTQADWQTCQSIAQQGEP